MSRLFAGAYVLSPSLRVCKPDEEDLFMAGLRRMEGLAGLEHPFYGDLHRWDEQAFLRSLDPRWSFTFTCLPGTMDRMTKDPSFGLASTSADGRRRALEFMQGAVRAAHRLNAHLGRKAVTAVAVHSAPRQEQHSRQAFARSLEELRSWDWQGALLLVEHCDRARADRAPDKGFLSLEDELWALDQSETPSCPAKILVNWGRSAVEERSPAGPEAHLAACKAAARLGGLMFSGAAQGHPHFGHWKDTHAPFQGEEPLSVMGDAELSACLRLAEPETLAVLGFKVMLRPEDAPLEARLALIRASLERMQSSLKAAA